MVNVDEIRAMKNNEVNTTDKSRLVDITDVHIDSSEPQIERIEQLISQIDNPYCFKCDDVVVHIQHTDTERNLSKILVNFFSNLKG